MTPLPSRLHSEVLPTTTLAGHEKGIQQRNSNEILFRDDCRILVTNDSLFHHDQSHLNHPTATDTADTLRHTTAVHSSVTVFQRSGIHAAELPPPPVDPKQSDTVPSSLEKKPVDVRRLKDQKITLPLVTLVLSVLFPPLGCVGFLCCLRSELGSPRNVWAVRSLYLGSALAFIYMFIIVSIIGGKYPESR